MMKYFFIFFLILSLTSFAQPTEFFKIDSIPTNSEQLDKNGVLLNKNWKFHAIDNPDFAKPDFNDNAWENIDPTRDILDFPQNFNSKIKWLRLNLEVSDKLKQPLGISITQAVASEIYLNGHLIHKIGILDADSNKIKAFDPIYTPLSIPIDSGGKYCLAVRYALQPNIHYTNLYALSKNKIFDAGIVNLVPTQNALWSYRVYYTGFEIFKIGIFFMLFVLHLAFYFYQKSNKTHLLLSLFFFFSLLQYVFKIWGQNQDSVEFRFFTLNASIWASAIANILALIAFYKLSKTRPDFYFKFAIFFAIISTIVSSITYGWIWSTLSLIEAFINFIVALRITHIGLKKKIKGYGILGVSVMISCLGFLAIELLILNFPINPYLVDVVFNLAAIAIPVGLSLFMGIEASETNKSLTNKLAENEDLKNQSIAQEKEKQQILATQNETLERQVTERTNELSLSLKELKATQNQLIQSEKLASLGELTAGIAHEIQNPLNFVNNFSELNVDLVKDIKDEMHKPEIDKSYVEDLLKDLTDNEKNINHHGKRAASIVSGMLEHSRTSTGKKELTDINKLCDEYFRLSYHGLSAKNKDFNAEMITNFDPTIPKIEIIPQDVGRVILNLINNAFYAVNEKRILDDGRRIIDNGQLTIDNENKEIYAPIVTVTTKKLENAIEIRVKDNGTGMSEAVRTKVFQPFFTTKPTGQGTGLGLSLAYDIITKGHGGTLTVESEEGVGSEFVILLLEK